MNLNKKKILQIVQNPLSTKGIKYIPKIKNHC